MFRGIHALNLDAKGRLSIPSRYRQQIEDMCEGRLILTIDTKDRCLLLYPLPDWEEIERKLDRLSGLNPQVRRVQRMLIGHATECEMDKQGRILVASLLQSFAGIEKQVVLVGQGKKFECWDAPTWNKARDEWFEESETELSPELEMLSL